MGSTPQDGLEKIWQEVLKEYQEIVGNSDVSNQVQDLSQVEKDGVINKSIESVTQVAEFVTGAVPLVSEHLETVLTALKYLAGTAQWYKANFTAGMVRKRLEEVTSDLRRVADYMKVYEEGASLDESLTDLIIQIMINLLRLCTIHAKVSKDSKKASGILKNVLRSAIRWDGGIAEYVEDIKKLTERELSLNVAAIRVSNIHTSEEKLRKKTSLKLQELLRVDESHKRGVETQKHLSGKHIQGMGNWLLNQSTKFASWADTLQRPAHSTLLFTGEPGFGKTHLCSRAICFLQEKYAQKSPSRCEEVTVAWVYFQQSENHQSSRMRRDRKKRPEDENEFIQYHNPQSSLRDALVSVIWQVSEKDSRFQKFVVEEFDLEPHGFRTARQLWTGILMRFCGHFQNPVSRPCKVFFIVIDGIDQLSKEDKNELKEMVQEAQSVNSSSGTCCQVRILLSSTDPDPTTSLESVPQITLPQDARRFDVEKFIGHHLENALNHWTKETEGHRVLWSMQKSITSMFGKGGIWNYHDLSGILQAINRTSAMSLFDLRNLEKALLTRNGDPSLSFTSKIMQRELEKLDREIDDEEKDTVNQILSCLVCWRYWPTVKQLHAFLFLQEEKESGKSTVQKLREEHPQLITVHYDDTAVAEDLWFFFFNCKNSKWYAQDEVPLHSKVSRPNQLWGRIKSQGPQSKHPAFDYHLVNSFVEIMKDHSMGRPRIGLDLMQSHFTIVLSLLRTICSKHHEERSGLKSLHGYAGIWLPYHMCKVMNYGGLKSATDPVTQKKKIRIGRLLYRFFMDERTVEIWLSRSDPQILRLNDWCGYVSEVHGWLEDAAVFEGFIGEKDIHESRRNADAASDGPRRSTPDIRHVSEDSDSKESDHLEGPDSKTASLKNVGVVEETEPWVLQRGSILGKYMRVRDTILWYTIGMPRQSFFSCTIKISASQWLEKYNWNASEAFKWLVCIASFAIKSDHENIEEVYLLDEENRDAIQNARKAFEQKNIESKHIKDVEEWAKKLLVIRGAHTRLYPTIDVRIAQTFFGLRVHDDHEEAEKRCEFAQHRDPSYFEATLCLSQILDENGRKERAFQELLKIRSYIQSSGFKETSPIRWKAELDRFWRLCDETEKVKEALVACVDLSYQFPDSREYIDKAAEWLLRANHLKDAFGPLTAIREAGERSFLTTLFSSHNGSNRRLHHHFHLALKDSPKLVLKGYTDTFMQESNHQMLLKLRHWYALSLLHQQKKKDAMEEWEAISLELEKQFNGSGSIDEQFIHNAEQLASLYITMIREETPSRDFSKHCIEKVQRCQELIKNWPYEDSHLALMLGRLHHVLGHPRTARKCVRKYLETAFGLLEDDREDNDWKGHFMLVEALNCLNDNENARAAWSLIASAHSEERACELSITCAGGCGWSWNGRSHLDRDIYFCKDCAHVQFEPGCYTKLRKGALEERVCWKDHQLTKIPKMNPRGKRRIEADKLLVGKAELDVQMWLDGIRQKYGIRRLQKLAWSARQAESIKIARWKLRLGVDENFGLSPVHVEGMLK